MGTRQTKNGCERRKHGQCETKRAHMPAQFFSFEPQQIRFSKRSETALHLASRGVDARARTKGVRQRRHQRRRRRRRGQREGKVAPVEHVGAGENEPVIPVAVIERHEPIVPVLSTHVESLGRTHARPRERLSYSFDLSHAAPQSSRAALNHSLNRSHRIQRSRSHEIAFRSRSSCVQVAFRERHSTAASTHSCRRAAPCTRAIASTALALVHMLLSWCY